ncbi:outer membrane beta-barrel protein [Christiangramia sabulilitoris]|uniref:PorT family protein n=1 Tax=Christiangramia sabulilitoris TaxID=2583991 RepID=A0A550I966_9FLAO|nr:outer membrane beta-barrel protein [Christiangramia sabulilitoris]TRO67502.1 PorT family protein [Christiangramia sabulilitoris]
MLKKSVFLLLIFFAVKSHSQRYRDYEIGPMVNYEHTSLYASQGVFPGGVGDDKSISGFEPSYAAGVYYIYYFKPKFGLGTELYFQRTTSSDLESGEYYNSLTFMPYVNFDPFRQISNWYFGAGFGAAFIQESPDYGARVKEEDIRVITVPVKISTSYRIRNHITFELGAQTEILEVVNDNVRRMAVFFGIKVPLNRLNRYYYR